MLISHDCVALQLIPCVFGGIGLDHKIRMLSEIVSTLHCDNAWNFSLF